MEKKIDRLEAIYDYLLSVGLAHTRKDLADKMNASPSTISRAFGGSDKYLTDNFLIRLNLAYGNIFNHKWLTRGEGDMFAENKTSSFKDRLELLANEEGYTMNALTKMISVHPSTLNNWLEGKTIPDNMKLQELCVYLNVSLEWLITGSGDMYTRPLEEDRIKYNEASPVNSKIKMIPLVSQYAQAGYLCGFADEEYVESLPTIPFMVDHEPKGNYMAFEVKGDSMFDGSYDSLVEGDLLMCREIDFDFWKSKLFIKKWNNFVVVHKEDGVLVKKIIDHDVERGLITLHSLNPLYEDRVMCLSEVSQLFSVIKISRSGNV